MQKLDRFTLRKKIFIFCQFNSTFCLYTDDTCLFIIVQSDADINLNFLSFVIAIQEMD